MAKNRAALAVLAAALVVGAAAWAFARYETERPRLGLMTSLPIYWPEARSIEERLTTELAPHRVRIALEKDYRLVPLDALSASDGSGSPRAELAELEFVFLAQPHALPPADLVAFDSWLRGGGRALVVVDPMLTEHSDFAFGDRRRPQDVAMLDPLLARWGLVLRFDVDQPQGMRLVPLGPPIALDLPVDLPGRLLRHRGGDVAANCTIEAAGLLAQCEIGEGRAVVVADAALVQAEPTDFAGAGAAALERLLDSSFK